MTEHTRRDAASGAKIALAIAVAAWMAVPSCTNPAGFIRVPTGIRGVVTVSGDPLAGTSVEIIRPRATAPTVLETDSLGAYSYSLVFAGLHRMKVSGYDRATYVFPDSMRLLDARFTGEVFIVDFMGESRP